MYWNLPAPMAENVKMFGAGAMHTKTCPTNKNLYLFLCKHKGETDNHLDKRENGYGSSVEPHRMQGKRIAGPYVLLNATDPDGTRPKRAFDKKLLEKK